MHVRLKRLLVLVPTALVVVFGFVLFEANRQVVSTFQSIDQTRQAESVLSDISMELERAARVRDAFIASPDPAPLRGLQVAVNDLRRTLGQLHGLLSTPLPERSRLQAVDSLVLGETDGLAAELRRAQAMPPAAAAAAMARRGRSGIDRVRGIVESALQREIGLFDGRMAREVAANRFIFWLIIGGTLVTVAAGLAMLRILGRDARAREVDRKRIAESEERFRAAFEQAAVGVSEVALDHHYVAVNQRFCRIVGYDEGELHHMTFEDLTHPEDVDVDLNSVERLVAGEIHSFHNEKRYMRKDGEVVWVNLYVSLVRDVDGAPRHFIAITEDLTERRRAEQALHESQAQLLQAQKMEALGRLAGGVAHDFNNLLTVITGHARMALEPGGHDEDLHQVIDTADHAAALTRQLLAFSRKSLARPQTVDVNDVVRHTLAMLRSLVGEDITLRTELSDDPLTVRADITQLEQVIMNLAVNARDAMPDGGTLTLRTACRLGHADGEGADRWALLTVQDTGCGMDAQVAERIFEPFFTTKEQGRGTGLGLSTVLGIIEQAGGHIDVASEPGAGAAFTVALPAFAQPATPAPETAPAPAREAGRGGERVLLVEDEPGVRHLLERVLANAGYTVHSASNGQKALDIVDDARPRLVLSDIVMPGLDGPHLAAQLRQRTPDCRFLFMSGYTVQSLDGFLEHNSFAFIEKPFSPGDLLAAVRRVLDR